MQPIDAAKEERVRRFCVCCCFRFKLAVLVDGGGDCCRRGLRLFLVLELVREPVEAFVETVAARGAGGLDVPVSVS